MGRKRVLIFYAKKMGGNLMKRGPKLGKKYLRERLCCSGMPCGEQMGEIGAGARSGGRGAAGAPLGSGMDGQMTGEKNQQWKLTAQPTSYFVKGQNAARDLKLAGFVTGDEWYPGWWPGEMRRPWSCSNQNILNIQPRLNFKCTMILN